MAKEIEHKFIVADDSFKAMATVAHSIKQGYISHEINGTVRVRIIDNEARLTVKGRTSGCMRSEFEYPIPIADAEEMLSSLCKLPAIDKTRYIVPFEGNIWEVDEFHGQLQGLILAEIEIPAPDYSYKIPQFIGQNVTDDARFYNSNLASATLADLNLNS